MVFQTLRSTLNKIPFFPLPVWILSNPVCKNCEGILWKHLYTLSCGYGILGIALLSKCLFFLFSCRLTYKTTPLQDRKEQLWNITKYYNLMCLRSCQDRILDDDWIILESCQDNSVTFGQPPSAYATSHKVVERQINWGGGRTVYAGLNSLEEG